MWYFLVAIGLCQGLYVWTRKGHKPREYGLRDWLPVHQYPLAHVVDIRRVVASHGEAFLREASCRLIAKPFALDKLLSVLGSATAPR